MSPHKPEFLLLFGTITTSWWAGMSQFQKTVWAAAAFVIVGIAIGSTGYQLFVERTGALARLDRVERIAIRDSIRMDRVELQHMDLLEMRERIEVMEDVMWRVDDRTKRIACLLAGNRGSACL